MAIDKSNYKTEIDRLKSKGLIDEVAIDIKTELDRLIPFYDEAPEIKEICDQAFKLLNENADLNMKDKNITDDGPSDDDDESIALTLFNFKLKLQLQVQAMKKQHKI